MEIMTNPNIHQLQVTKKMAKNRLDKFIALAAPELSRSMVKKLVEGGNVSRDGKIIEDCTYSVKEGEIYTVTIPAPVPTDMLAADIPLKIIYEDEQFLVIDKQAGLTVHPGAGNQQNTMANALIAHCGASLSGIGGVTRPGIVHRLDKDTSGLIMAAKTDLAHQSLSAQIASRELKRTYLAVCWGVPRPHEGRVEASIGRSSKNRKKMAVVTSGGKKAATNYSVIETLCGGAASLVECRLETGRTHQIRVHMTHIGHPLVGDQTYCGRRAGRLKKLPEDVQEKLSGFKRQALHSYKVILHHPATGKEMEFTSELPEDMAQLVELMAE